MPTWSARPDPQPGSGLATALDLYRAEARGVRAHVAGRWKSCPFEAVATHVPPGGRVLEIGCGHGLLAAHLALESAAREVTGTDIDPKKIEVAQRAAVGATNLGAHLDFRVEPAGAVPPGPWDTIVVADVFYLLPAEPAKGLLEAMAATLADGGRIVLKETSHTPRWKYLLARAQELMSVRVLRITAGRDLVFHEPAALRRWLEEAGLVVSEHPVHRGYLHPHHVLVGSRTPL